ncbi:MAG: SDR family oxidoreductase [Deltaproteobacteria bacterium]|nr:SDR family oxidoreductase [Deltaproteobacteria bacterium]MBW2360620.1 SDR family oxidoreductase [Deltaproteobacteria bacterium]
MDLKDRVALVTGGGRGIGRAIALAMADAGCDVAVSARTPSEIEQVADDVRARGGRGLPVRADAMSEPDIRASVETVVRELGRIDILVNNVGGMPATNDPDRQTLDTLALNLVSADRATRAALPHMKRQAYGRVINIGSGSAKRTGASPAYTAAKHGIVGLTRATAALVATQGITVNCLCPGWTNTSAVDWNVLAAAWKTDPETARARASGESLQNRVLEPEELGPMAVLLASPQASGITGQVISVDGGYKV